MQNSAIDGRMRVNFRLTSLLRGSGGVMGDKNYAALFHSYVLLCLLLFASAIVQAEQLPIKKYTTADGLAHDQINRIIQDSNRKRVNCKGLTNSIMTQGS